MKALPYFPLYPDDFEASAAHLTLAEDGALNRALRLCWRQPNCVLPNDIEWICRRMRALNDEDRSTIERVIDEFFLRKGGRLFHPRLTEEFAKAQAAYEARASAGKKGAAAKSLKNRDFRPSNVLGELEHCFSNQTQNQSQIQNDVSTTAGPPLTVIPEDPTVQATGLEMTAESLRLELMRILGVEIQSPPTYWRAPSAIAHINRWIFEWKLPPAQIIKVARESRAHHPEPPNGPKALDKRLNRIAFGGGAAEIHSQDADLNHCAVPRTMARLPGVPSDA